MKRKEVHQIFVNRTISELEERTHKALDKHGWGAFVSTHEIYGTLAEEIHELLEAIQSNNISEVQRELLDVAQTALFGYASIESWTGDLL